VQFEEKLVKSEEEKKEIHDTAVRLQQTLQEELQQQRQKLTEAEARAQEKGLQEAQEWSQQLARLEEHKAAAEALRTELLVTSQKLEQTDAGMQKLGLERESLMDELSALRKEMEIEKQRMAVREEEVNTIMSASSTEEDELERRLAAVEKERQQAELTITQLRCAKDESSNEFEALASQLENLSLELEHTKRCLVDTGTDSDSKLKALEAKLQETLAENMALGKQGRDLLTPLMTNPSVRSITTDHASRRCSIGDSSTRSNSDLSDMGKVISASHVHFTQKIKQRVDGLEMARDQLALEYRKSYDAMVEEKDGLEEQLESRNAVELETARSKLKASYARLDDDDTGINAMVSTESEGHVGGFHMQDSRLVAEHAERRSNRRSQIQYRHESQFQALSEDYDKKIETMLESDAMIESDLSIAPERFEELSDRLHSTTNSPAAVRQRPLRTASSRDYLHGDSVARSAYQQQPWHSVDSYARKRVESPSGFGGASFSPLRPQTADAQGITRKSSHSRLSSFMGRLHSPFGSSRSSRSSTGTRTSRPGSARPRSGQRVVSTPPPKSRPEYNRHNLSDVSSSTLVRNSRLQRPMTADAEMDFSIAPAQFEALQQGQEVESYGERGRTVEQHKSARMLRCISGSIRKKMSS
jgi:hypothetical protein